MYTKTCGVCTSEFITKKKVQHVCDRICLRAWRTLSGATSNLLSPTDAAYIAGLVDGEGWIGLTGKSGARVVIKLGVANTSLSVLQWCQQVTGVGSLVSNSQQRTRACWTWQVSSGAVTSVLTQTRPYMRIKEGQADLVIEAGKRLASRGGQQDRLWVDEFQRLLSLDRAGDMILHGYPTTTAYVPGTRTGSGT